MQGDPAAPDGAKEECSEEEEERHGPVMAGCLPLAPPHSSKEGVQDAVERKEEEDDE